MFWQTVYEGLVIVFGEEWCLRWLLPIPGGALVRPPVRSPSMLPRSRLLLHDGFWLSRRERLNSRKFVQVFAAALALVRAQKGALLLAQG